MLAAVRLDDETRFVTNEIRDIRSDWDLPPELGPRELAVAKDAPEHMLGLGHATTQATSPAKRSRASDFPLTRRPARPAATLSRKGRGFSLAAHRAISQVVWISPVTGFFASFRATPMAA